MTEPLFIVSREDWSLHRKGYEDQSRHRQRVKDALRRNLSDIVSDESIVLSDGRKQVRVPIRSLDEFRFRFNYNKTKHVGQGDGDSKVGDVLGRDPQPSQQPGGGEGGAGDKPGEDAYDTEVDMEELENVLFEDWELPALQHKDKRIVQTEHTRFTDVRKKGMMANIDRKRTLLENLKRNAAHGVRGFGGIAPDDLRFKTWETVRRPESNALILAMMDTSGSMGSFEKYCARSFFFWMTRFLRRKYEHVEIVFIAHHTEAKEVTEEEFFTKGESGGTICSSAYHKAIDIIDSRFPPAQYNIYPFHFSDGDNLTSDNERCMKLIRELLQRSNLFGYGEVNQYNRSSTLMSAYRNLNESGFVYAIIKEKGEVLKALRTFFARKEPAGG